MKISIIGCHSMEPKDFLVERPSGLGEYLYLHFHTDIYMIIDGIKKHYAPGTCVIFSPDYPQFYHNPYSGFDNDWLHFQGNDVVPLLKALDLVLNKPFQIPDADTIRRHIKVIEAEHLMKQRHSQLMTDLLLRQLLILTRRSLIGENSRQTSDMENQFRSCRSHILSKLNEPWTVPTMAALVGLSPSRFSSLYRQFFKTSPKEDLLSERMNVARYLLINPNQSISDIAAKVGYESIHHFSKQFKLRYNMSPSAYRRDGSPSK